MTETSAVSPRTERKRVQIRDAARQLFLRHGFQATSTDAIMAAAGIASKETLYRYYAKKEDIFVDVLRSLTVERPYLRQFMQPTPSPTSVHDLRKLLRVLARDILETTLQPDYLAVIRITMAELPRFPELGMLFRQTVPEQGLEYLLTLLRRGQANGVVRKNKDLDTIGRMFLGTLLTYAIFDGLLVSTQVPRMPEPSVIDAIVDNVMDVVSAKNEE